MKQEFFTENWTNVVAKVLFATAAMLAFMIWNTPGVAQGGGSLPPCGDEITGCHGWEFEEKCQIKSSIEEPCEDNWFNYKANFVVRREIWKTCYDGGYIYTCYQWHRNGGCCTIVHNPLPPCPADTCEASGIGGG